MEVNHISKEDLIGIGELLLFSYSFGEKSKELYLIVDHNTSRIFYKIEKMINMNFSSDYYPTLDLAVENYNSIEIYP